MTAALHRTHTEIFHLIRFMDRLVAEIPEEGPGPEDLTDLRRVLYGLDAILRLHMAQEEELYVALGDEHPEAAPVAPRPPEGDRASTLQPLPDQAWARAASRMAHVRRCVRSASS